jgi:hypothetical protein
MRSGGKHRPQQAVSHWARVSAQCDAPRRAHYPALRPRGHAHPRAVRGGADRLLALLIALRKRDTRYDAARPRKRVLAA